jgi:hypothetical protein
MCDPTVRTPPATVTTVIADTNSIEKALGGLLCL